MCCCQLFLIYVCVLFVEFNEKRAFFFTSEQPKIFKFWSCQKVCDALLYLLENIFIRFGLSLYRQIVSIPMGVICSPIVSDLHLFL